MMRFHLMLVVLLVGCSAGNRQPTGARHPNIIYVSSSTATGLDTGLTTETTTGQTTGVTTGTSTLDAAGLVSGDVASATPDGEAVRCVSGNLFPSCQGTKEQVGDCIINLPSRFGLVVTSPEPMEFNACKP